MLPDKLDPRWERLVRDQRDIPLQGLATKMILMRVRLLVKADPSAEKIQEAVNIAYDFFKKNEYSVQDDIKTIFEQDI
ncbi:MAG: hypothetical protein AAGB31_13335 [Bdellovibrio sp.]